MTKKAIGFVRDSLGNEDALERQRKKIRTHCSSNGYELGEIYEATGRWSVHQNDELFAKIISENPEADTLLVGEIGRLTHDFGELKTILEMFRANGIEVESLNERDWSILNENHPLHEKVMAELEIVSGMSEEFSASYETAGEEESESEYSR